ncbi:MAG: hypothetical protein QOH46_702 [Solirubrobacteraceae bacterium]|nr:hypothetical protein [Solirubrobacteraceae bacterium]
MARVDDPTPADPRDDELAERGRALVARASAATPAPPALRARIAADRDRARPIRRRRVVLAGSLAGLAAAAAAALVISLAQSPAPSVTAASQLGDRPPTLAAPPVDRRNSALLRTSVEGTPFPDWSRDFPWRAAGARRDELKGRVATTVFYDNPRGERLAYTIVAGGPLDRPDGARMLTVRGTTFDLLRRGTENVVVWERGGHTCVMSGPARVPEERLLDLAAWDAGGGVPF